MKTAVFNLLKIAVTAALLMLLYARADPAQLSKILSAVSLVHVAAAVILHIVVFLIGGLRWWLLLRRHSKEVRFGEILPSYYIGVFCSNFFPTTAGGDVVRTIHLHLLGYQSRILIASAVIDRMLGLLSVLFIGGLALVMLPDNVAARKIGASVLLLLALAPLPMALLLSPSMQARLKGINQRHAQHKVFGFLLATLSACHAYLQARGLLVMGFIISLAIHGLLILTYHLLAVSVGLQLSIATLFYVIPIVILAANLPISLGGLGVREATLVGVLALIPVDAQQAISLSLLYLLVLWVASLPGAVAMLWRKKTPVDRGL